MSQLKVNSIVPAGGIPAGASGGGIIQCVSTTKTDTFSTTTQTTWVDVTGFNVSITPRSTSNKIMVLVSFYASISGNSGGYYQRLMRDSTAICIGNAAGSRQRASSYTITNTAITNGFSAVTPQQIIHLDSPATTSSVTYKLQTYLIPGTNTWQFNYGVNDTDNSNQGRYASSFTVMEISG